MTTKTTTTTTPEPCEPSWKVGVVQHCQKCKAALKFYVGPTYKTAKTILDAFLCLVPKLESSTESNSNIISSKSVAILETISLMSDVGNSPTGILNGFIDVLHTVAAAYKQIILSLSVHIGVLTPSVIDAITALESSLYKIMDDYQNAALLNVGDDDIDYKPVLQGIQNLTNAVACIAEARLPLCKYDENVRDSLYILALILDHLLIIGHAANVSIAAALRISCGSFSNTLSQCLAIIDPLVNGITAALGAVAKTLIESVVLVLNAIVDLAKSLNDVLKAVFGLVQDVTATLGTVTKSLTKTISGTLAGVTKGLNLGNLLGK